MELEILFMELAILLMELEILFMKSEISFSNLINFWHSGRFLSYFFVNFIFSSQCFPWLNSCELYNIWQFSRFSSVMLAWSGNWNSINCLRVQSPENVKKMRFWRKCSGLEAQEGVRWEKSVGRFLLNNWCFGLDFEVSNWICGVQIDLWLILQSSVEVCPNLLIL